MDFNNNRVIMLLMIERKILSDLVKNLPKKEISFIIGLRQLGKTTLMELLKKQLHKNGEQTGQFLSGETSCFFNS